VVARTPTGMRGGDVALLTAGGLLVASGFRHAEGSAVARTRADVNRRMQALRRRGVNASSLVAVVIGAGVIVLVAARIGRDLADTARNALEQDATAPETSTEA
jgi:hypothetical protein